jgi:hypothetical protein
MTTKLQDKRLNCTACGAQASMFPDKVSKMSPVVQIIGWIIAVPSIIGVVLSVLFFVLGIAGIGAQASETDTDQAAQGLAVMLTGSMSVCMGISSLLSGLFGYLLIMKKKVWKCSNCGFHLDRD